MEAPWQSVQNAPENVEIETKIDDANGVRNIQTMIFYRNLWWINDKEMYVYYRPTHWRPIDEKKT